MESIRVELHCHTYRSADCLVRPRDLLLRARRLGLDRIAITDHGEIEGALEAASLDPQRVIVGEEILTTKGELLAFFLTEKVPRGLEPKEAIRRLRQQGALISVSHPFDANRSGAWKPDDLLAIAEHVDAIEVFNARCLGAGPNRRANEFARAHGLLGTAGSDAHTIGEIGRASMVLPAFANAEGMLGSLRQARIEGHLSSPFVHFHSRWAVWRKAMDKGAGEDGSNGRS
jgi:predicted metal-dependent phosphoesterase TrpH